MTVFPMRKAQRQFKDLLRAAAKGPVRIEKRGAVQAFVVSPVHYRLMTATLTLVRHQAMGEAVEAAGDAVAEIRTGRAHAHLRRARALMQAQARARHDFGTAGDAPPFDDAPPLTMRHVDGGAGEA